MVITGLSYNIGTYERRAAKFRKTTVKFLLEEYVFIIELADADPFCILVM